MINIGFEFEFVSDLEKKEIRDIFTEFTGEKIIGQHWENQTSGKHWVLTEDPSCVIKKAYEAGYEIISPIFDLSQSWEVMTAVFDFINYIGAETKMSTGMHVNIDFGEATKDLDPVELVILLNELELIDKYNRKYNKYCVPYINKIRNRISKYKKHYTYTEIKDKVYDTVVGSGKYQTVNFMNLKKRGYIEFRIIGGEDYHYRIDEIFKDIMHFVDCLQGAIYGNKKRTIIKKLNKLLKVKI